MPIKYYYDPDKNIVFTHASEEISTAELREYFETLLADKNIADGFWEVVNTAGSNNIILTLNDCVELSSIIKKFVTEKNYQGAILYAPNKLSASIIKLLFSVLRSVMPQMFYIEQDHDKFKALVKKQFGFNYDFGLVKK